MTSLVFVYGTLKRGLPNHHLLADTEFGLCVPRGTAVTVEKFPLVVASDYNIPFLLHAPGQGQQIKGELYEVDATRLAKLDELEAHPRLYERLEIQLTPDNTDLCGQSTKNSKTKGDNSNTTETNGDTINKGDNRITAESYFLVKYKPNLLELPTTNWYSNEKGKEYVTAAARSNFSTKWWGQVHRNYEI